jgi:hypothetical protein
MVSDVSTGHAVMVNTRATFSLVAEFKSKSVDWMSLLRFFPGVSRRSTTCIVLAQLVNLTL